MKSPLPADRVRALTAHCRPIEAPIPQKVKRGRDLSPEALREYNLERARRWRENNPDKVALYLKRKAKRRKEKRESR